MWKIEKLPASINLGNQVENDTKIIQIDVSAWNTLYPGCAYHITAMRPGDTGNWPVTGVTHADGVLTWVVPNTVTSVPGQGSLVIHCTLDGKEKNTGSFWYSVGPGHAAMGDAPDVIADYVAEMAAYANQAQEAATLLQGVSLSVNIEAGTLELWADGLSPIDIGINGNNLEVYKA